MELVDALSLDDSDHPVCSFDWGDNADFVLDTPKLGSKIRVLTSPSREQKKTHHRESMARLRGEQRARIERLAIEEKALHKQLRTVLAKRDRHPSAYKQLVEAAELLMQDQYSFENNLVIYQKYRRFVETEGVRVSEDALPPCSEDRDDATKPQKLVLYDATACEAVVKMAIESIEEIRERLSIPHPSVAACSSIRWDVKSFVDDQVRLHCQLTRQVQCSAVSLDELDQHTWTMLRSPDHVARLSQSAIAIRMFERISDHVFTAMASYRDSSGFPILMTRRRDQNEDSVVFITTELAKHTSSPLSVGLRFTKLDGFIEIECIGVLRATSAASRHRLLIDCCATVLRWEHLAVPSSVVLVDPVR